MSGRDRVLRQEVVMHFVAEMGQKAEAVPRIFPHVAQTRQSAE